jgi:FMN reductase
MRIAVVVGNPKRDSRTLAVALATADALERRLEYPWRRVVIDLAEVAPELFDPEAQAVNDLLETVAHSDLVIVASPTYKAAYTGLLKSFLDRYSNNALQQTLAVCVMTGAAPVHALAVDVHLRPLLIELGASTPTRSLFVVEQQFTDLDAVIDPWADGAAELIDRVLSRPVGEGTLSAVQTDQTV